MSSKQRSIKDHFKALKSNELVEKEPNVYPLFRSKAIEKKTTKKPKLCRPKATKILPPQTAATATAVPPKPVAKARTKPTARHVDLTSVTMATESIRMGVRSRQPTPSLQDIITHDTHQFYLNQKKKREHISNQSQQQQLNQPIACSQRLDMKEIDIQMSAYHTASWKQDRCCKALYDQIPDIRRNSTKKTMWRDKYRPTKAEGLLGYLPDYEYVRDWLNQLKIKTPTMRETSAAAAKNKKKTREQDKDAIYNLILFVGDYGSGKTASVYTVAKETGYSIFEINSSSRRTGRDVTDSVGEMTESHLVRFTSNANKRKVQGETIILRDTVKTKKPKTIDIAEHFKRMMSMQNGTSESSHPAEPVKPAEPPAQPDPLSPPPPQNTLEAFFKKAKVKQDLALEELANQPKQSLLLFEEVDILFEEDKGFWTAIIDLCQKSKRPIIMTCNDESKIPFDFFNIQCTTYFEKATTEQDRASFVQYMHLICYAENYSIPKREIAYLCELLEYDTRQIIDMLQFWLNETPLTTTDHFVYQNLFAHIMGFADSLISKDVMQLMDHLKGCQSRVIEICTRYYYEYADEDQEQEVMRIEDLYQVMENASFADAWVGLKDKHRHQLYDIDQYNAHQDGYQGNDTRVIYKDATDLDHWELGEIMDNSITVMNLATINKNNSWRNHLSAWSSHWEYLWNARKLYSDDCLITCKHILSQKEQRFDLILSEYMPIIRSLSQYDQGLAGKGRTVRTRKKLRYLQLSDESRDALNWQHTLA
ncbi:hypothetical protein PS15m_003315 [Mucor circinelloides]